MRKRFLVGFGVVATTIVAFVATSRRSDAQQPTKPGPAVLSAADTASLQGPRQPIFFRHDVHAGMLKLQCQYCHYSVSVSSEPGIPSLQTCMGCHAIIQGGMVKSPENQAEIKKLTTAWANKTPVEWVRVHTVAKHVHFPHMRHIKALGPQACATCHGNVAMMPQVFKVNNVNNMGFCISCHLERKITRDCSVCHY